MIYTDGTELQQFDNEGIFHQIGEVQHHKAALFILFKPENPEIKIELIVPQGATLTHFYRNIVLNALTPWEKKHRIYVFGYEVNGHSHYNFILPDDRLIQSTSKELQLSMQVTN